LTVFIISYAYSRIIEHFPSGGGGYIVASHTLGNRAGVVSGSALLVDYILTITVSIASCGDALFSFLPLSYQPAKLPFEMLLILTLIVLNIRGVKESITVLAPIFVVFILTHIFLIGYGVLSHLPQVVPVVQGVQRDFKAGLATLGGAGMLALFLRAYSLGGGTYTGIEAVSNGLQSANRGSVGKKPCSIWLLLAFTAECSSVPAAEGRPGEGFAQFLLATSLFGQESGRAGVYHLLQGALPSPPRRVLSTAPASWPTWPSTPGSLTASPLCASA
jgi:hypothetical protein